MGSDQVADALYGVREPRFGDYQEVDVQLVDDVDDRLLFCGLPEGARVDRANRDLIQRCRAGADIICAGID